MLRLLWSTTWLLPCVTKAGEPYKANTNITTLPTAINTTWYPYPRSIQLRFGGMKGKNMLIIPTTLDLDILYAHDCFARQLEAYPRIGLSFLMPYALNKDLKIIFPHLWGGLAYMELYQAHPALSTWGNRISMGVIHGGSLLDLAARPNHSFVVIKEITYHSWCVPSWQLNVSIGALINFCFKKTDYKDEEPWTLIGTIGMRYITHQAPYLKLVYKPINYKKREKSRVDCSITGSSRYLRSTKKYYPILRGSSLLSFAINNHNALLCAFELGYNGYKKALLTNMFSAAGIELTPLLGYEIRYGRYLLQLQMGYDITDTKKPSVQDSYNKTPKNMHNEMLKERVICINIQYMLTERFFVGIAVRPKEGIPGMRLGVSL